MLFKSFLFTLTVAALAIVGSTSPIKKRSFGGYNDLSCKPTAKHPHPLILLHGLLESSAVWVYMGPQFASKGYCVFSLDYGRLLNIPVGGLNDINESAQELSDFVDKVLAATGASKVDILGHSEGSLPPRVYFKHLNGIQKTGSIAAIGSSQYGTNLHNVVPLLQQLNLFGPVHGALSPLCKACLQLTANSPFLDELNKGRDTYPEIKYLMLVSKYDEMVSPYTNGYLKTLGPNVHNVCLQDLCESDISEHFVQLIDPVAFNAVDSFLSTGEVNKSGCSSGIL